MRHRWVRWSVRALVLLAAVISPLLLEVQPAMAQTPSETTVCSVAVVDKGI